MHCFLKFIFGIKFYMFQTVALSIIRCFSLYTQQWYISCRFADGLQAGSGWSSILILLAKAVRHIPLLCVQWKSPNDRRRNCPKHAEFHSKNKFEKLVHLVGFIVSIYHDAWSPEWQIKKKNLSHCDLVHQKLQHRLSWDWTHAFTSTQDGK